MAAGVLHGIAGARGVRPRAWLARRAGGDLPVLTVFGAMAVWIGLEVALVALIVRLVARVL